MYLLRMQGAAPAAFCRMIRTVCGEDAGRTILAQIPFSGMMGYHDDAGEGAVEGKAYGDKSMKLSIRKKILCILIMLVCCFLVYNLIWYLVVEHKYGAYAAGMERDTARGSRISDKHFNSVAENVDYTVKYPFYLEYVGNLAVVKRDTQEALIIWPGIVGDDEYGLVLEYENEIYRIVVDKNMAPINSFYNIYIADNEDTVRILVDAANEKWPGIFGT